MINEFNNLNNLIRTETAKAIRSILEGNLGDNTEEQERERQRQQAADVDARGASVSSKSSKKTDEAEEETDDAGEENEKETTDSEQREDRTGGKGTADSPKIKTPKLDQLEKPTIASVIDKLNALRGGKSLKDPAVRSGLVP